MPDVMNPRNRIVIALILLVLIFSAVYLRGKNLGRLDFWTDEVNHVFAAKSLNETGKPELPSGMRYERALLYTRIMALSFRIFGVNETSARIPSVLFGLLGILLLFSIGTRMGWRHVGLFAAFFMTFSFFDIGWSRIARFYTFFQFLYILGTLLFYYAFEGTGEPQMVDFPAFFRGFGIRWIYLVGSVFVLILSFSVQLLTGMFFISLVFYIVGLNLYHFIVDGKRTFKSQYFLCMCVLVILFFLGVLFYDFTGWIKWSMSYTPDFVTQSQISNRYFYYDYLNSNMMFPINAFFLIGVYYAITRAKKIVYYTLINLFVPLAFTSFVFAYQLPQYIFHVYPFYLLIAAYGAANFFESEVHSMTSQMEGKFKKQHLFKPSIVRKWVFLLFFIWLPVTIWFKLGVRTPARKAGQYNHVVTHRNWKWAAEYVNRQKTNQDVVVSSNTLIPLYYGLRSDYSLNIGFNDLAVATGFAEDKNHISDPYTGTPSIQNKEDIERIVSEHESGWIIVSTYCLNEVTYIPSEVKAFITSNLELEAEDQQGTVYIYRW